LGVSPTREQAKIKIIPSNKPNRPTSTTNKPTHQLTEHKQRQKISIVPKFVIFFGNFEMIYEIFLILNGQSFQNLREFMENDLPSKMFISASVLFSI